VESELEVDAPEFGVAAGSVAHPNRSAVTKSKSKSANRDGVVKATSGDMRGLVSHLLRLSIQNKFR
jgi:hypothetical protein